MVTWSPLPFAVNASLNLSNITRLMRHPIHKDNFRVIFCTRYVTVEMIRIFKLWNAVVSLCHREK